MKLIKKITQIISSFALLVCLTACSNLEENVENNIKAYMQNLSSLTEENYVKWVSDNIENPYEDAALDLNQIKDGQVSYFVQCLKLMEYEIGEIDKDNQCVNVKVKYADSNEYVVNLISQLFAFAFSEDYSEEGENQIYLDVLNSIEEYTLLEDVVCFTFDSKGKIETVSNNIFDVVTAGVYEIMLGEKQDILYSEEELLANIDFKYDVFDEEKILITCSNHNDVAVEVIAYFNFIDKEGNVVAGSQATIKALATNETNYAYAYNEFGDDIKDCTVELDAGYYEDGSIKFFDRSLVPYEIKQEEDKVTLSFTNNADEIIDIDGGYFVYNDKGEVIYFSEINITSLDSKQSNETWFYLDSEYDEASDKWISETFDHIVVYQNAHTIANAIDVD